MLKEVPEVLAGDLLRRCWLLMLGNLGIHALKLLLLNATYSNSSSEAHPLA
jgi:hypothetical protein